MFERHLFDMIPGAWKKLGTTTVPASLPNHPDTPIRPRLDPTHKIATPEFPPQISGSGRIISRRLSAINDECQSNTMKNVVNYRQSVRMNELELQNKPIPKFTIRLKGKVKI